MVKKQAAQVQALLLTQNAEVKPISLGLGKTGALESGAIRSALKRKDAPEPIGSYTTKAFTLFLFGYSTGKAGCENKHELPPPHDTGLYFGDILCLASKDAESWASPCALSVEEYESFYTKAFGGFDGTESGDEDAEAGAEDAVEDAGEEAVEDAVEEGEEEEEEVEEEEEEEVGGEEEAGGEVGEEEGEVVPTPRRSRAAAGAGGAARVRKTKKAAAAGAAGGSGDSDLYTTYLHVTESDQLREELFLEETLPPMESLAAPRRKILATLHTLFADHLSKVEIRFLEVAIFNGTIRAAAQRHIALAWYHPFEDLYKMYAKHIVANFHPNSYVGNSELFARFKEGSIAISDLCGMDSYQLFEERWRESFVQQQQREKRQLEGNRAMATDRFTCTRCWKKECTYYEMQTRSADEPMTIFITCLNCGKHWRQ
jgi:DNA-directed RNA polymerase subunit M/transcription elongation factor TFIIS